ncbi:MAG: protein sphX, partial [Okeania sp. SIO1H6]|nr:protein sphX [Okeania sp. SIO1H6]
MVTTKIKNLKLNKRKLASVFVLVATTLATTISLVRSQSPSTIKVDGSSTVYPITEAVAEEFQKQKRGFMRVTVGISGTGGGFQKFCSQEDSVRTDISDASRIIQPSEIEKCKAAGIEFIELPIAYDAITVVVNTENLVDTMTVEELKKMWAPEAQGKVMRWNQVNSNWPDAELRMYGPGADSGTFDYFTHEIVGKSKASRSDYTPSEDDNVLVQGVA